MGKKKYNEEQFQEAIAMRRLGKSIPEITEKTTIKRPSLIKLFQENNIKLSEEDKERLVLGARWKNHQPIINGKKSCFRCKQILPVDMFYSYAKRKSGLLSHCIACLKQEYIVNSKAVKKRVKAYRKRNKEIIKEKDRLYWEKRRMLGISKPDTWRKNNPEKAKEVGRKWRAGNKDQIRAKNASYRATRANRTPPWQTKKEKKEISEFYKKCPEGYEVDHIVPLHSSFVSGLHVLKNLQYLKKELNNHKWAHFVDLANIGTCFQHKRKQQTEAEDREFGAPFGCDIKDFVFAKEELATEHRLFIERYEWLGKMGYIQKPEIYTARHIATGALGGVVVIDEPNSPQGGIPKGTEGLIHRGASASWTPKNLGSKLVMFACRESSRSTSRRFFTAYSDPDAGEIGTIYQACNFIYMGHRFGSTTMYQLSSGSSVSSSYFRKTSTYKRYAKELGIEWQPEWSKQSGYKDIAKIPLNVLKMLKKRGREEKNSCLSRTVPPKAKYLLILGPNRKETMRLKKIYGHLFVSFPYVKRGKGLPKP